MKQAKFCLTLALVVVLLGDGAWLVAAASGSGDTPAPAPALQSQLAKLIPPDDEAMVYFGDSVAASGDTIVVGASQEEAPGSLSGAAFVYYRNEGGPDAWGQVARLAADEPTGMDTFGSSVWVDGDTIMVGAPGADVGDNPLQGVVYVFDRDEGGADAWGQVARLTSSDGAEEDEFGGSIAISGDTAIIGAEGADGGEADQGAAYIFTRGEGGAWVEAARLTAEDGAEDDGFGAAVALSGNTALAGAEGADTGGKADRGAAYVFSQDQDGAGAWGQVAKLVAGDGVKGDAFGSSVAISGDTAVVGAEVADPGGSADQGAAYLFSRDEGGSGAWGQVAKLATDDGAAGDGFGAAVAVSGDAVLAGAEAADAGGNEDQGAAYLFSRDEGGAGAWGQAAKLTAGDGAAGDAFGSSVAISGDTAVMGAPGAVTPSNVVGAAYVYGLKPVAENVIYLPLVQRNS